MANGKIMKSIFKWKTIRKKVWKKSKTSAKNYLHLVNRNVSTIKEEVDSGIMEILDCLLSLTQDPHIWG